MSLNRLKNMFEKGEGALGTFFAAGNQNYMECLGFSGLDFVIIDCEHGPFDTETMMDLIRAAERSGLVPWVRIANVDHKEIQRAADCGAQGLIIPCLREVEDFKKAADLAKYTPMGHRGFIKGRGTGYGCAEWADTKTLQEYFDNSNDRLMVIPQCETIEALENIEEIVKIDGIDGIFIGPFDLSTCMGIAGQLDLPEFKAAEEKVFSACKSAGKPCYNFTTIPAVASDYINRGYAGVAVNMDCMIFLDAYKELNAKIRKNISK
ncbi:MAG: hypothetical protein IJM17_06005 [Firmicutes bacterium]|nr:hypothetical protein [Bacillota bacterium]